MKKYCDDCTYWNTVPSEIGLGCECRLHYPKESPIRKNDLGRRFNPDIENKDNNCPGYKPTLRKRLVSLIKPVTIKEQGNG
jgi:hypothetical protein